MGGKTISYFLKQNALSAIFALLPFLISELLVNDYRMNRITGVELEIINRASVIISFAGIVISVVGFYWLIRRFLPSKIANFVVAILWVPYYWCYIHVFAELFPMNNPADDANPAIGIIILGGLFLYPLLLAGVNALVLFTNKHGWFS